MGKLRPDRAAYLRREGMRWPEEERSEKCGGTGRDGTRMRKHGLRIHRKARKIFSDEILLNNVNDARVIGL